jgi:hypothetical protein
MLADGSLAADAQDDGAQSNDANQPGDGGPSTSDAAPESRSCKAGATPLRQIAPLSTSYATSVRPTFKWEGGGSCGTTIDLCADPTCSQVLQTITAAEGATSGRPTTDLPRGVVFWRARSGDSSTFVWSAFIGKGTNVDSSGGTFSDFNGDGRSDVAVGAAQGAVLVYYGSAGGLAIPPTILTASALDGEISSPGDVSGDGFSDLVVISPMTASDTHIQLRIFKGKAKGLDQAPSQTLAVETATPPSVAGLGLTARGGFDANGDGYGDFVVFIGRSGALLMFGGQDGLLFGGRIELAATIGETGSHAVALCDLDGDGIQDIAALDSTGAEGPNPVVFKGTGAGFARQEKGLPSHGVDAEAFQTLACADLRGDGYPDIVAGAPRSSVRDVGLGDTAVFENVMGTISKTGVSIAGQGGESQAYSSLRLLQIGDMNSDGIDDVAIGLGGEVGKVQVAFGALSGTPTDTIEIGGTPDVDGGFDAALAGGDFDGDGLSDLLVSSPGHGNGRLTLFRGSRSARILSPSAIHVDAPTDVTGLGSRFSVGR